MFKAMIYATTMALLATGAAFADTTTPAPKAPCDKCKPVEVSKPVTNGKGLVTGYRTVTEMNCPDCMDAITSLLNKGKLEHTCAVCGDHVKEACAGH